VARFKPGVSGNPGGRRRTPDAIREALAAATPRAVARLVALVDDDDPRVALRAAEAVLEKTLAPAPLPAPIPEGDRVALVEDRLLALALSGDRGAALAYLSAHAPDRYGAASDDSRASPDAVDTVDFVPRVVQVTS